MKNLLNLFTFLAIVLISCSNSSKESIKKEIDHCEKIDIELNNPTPPDGYRRYFDCDSNAVYKFIHEDTIRIYSWAGSFAVDEKEMSSLQLEDDFNMFRYPKLKQKNGTYLMVVLELTEFLFRNDTLYLLDTYNDVQVEKMLEINSQMMNGEISKIEYENKISEVSKQDFGFIPMYKAIYYVGIFDKESFIVLPNQINHRGESVTLVSKWKKNGKDYYEIVLHSERTSDQLFIFNEDMSYLDLEGCK